MDLENQVNKINGALNTLYSEYQKTDEGWPHEEFDLPHLIPMGDGDKIVNIEVVKKIIANLAKNNTVKFKELFKGRGQRESSTSAPPGTTMSNAEEDDAGAASAPLVQRLGGKKKTYKKKEKTYKKKINKKKTL